MAYEVTATRRRPKIFDALVGQEFVVATLRNSLKTGRIAHAYLFSGPRGVGKTSAARILARSLNCPSGPTADPCDDFAGSEEISRGTSLDVIEIDGASNTSVNDVRQIKDEVLFAPQSSRYKIYIIDEVHMLSNSAFNALLKTIEEPPPYIIFIFATTEIHKVPATIRSRCQQFNFRLIPAERIMECLRDAAGELGIDAEEDALFWVAREAGGSLRDAYTIFDQVAAFSDGTIRMAGIREKLGLLGAEQIAGMLEAMRVKDHGRVLELAEELVAGGVSVEQFVIELAEYYRALLFVKHGVRKESVLGYRVDTLPQNLVDEYSADQLEKAIELLLTLYRNIRYSLNPRFELELVLSRLAGLGDYLSAGEISRGIARIRQEIVEGKLSTRRTSVPSSAVPQNPVSEHRSPAELSARTDDDAEDSDIGDESEYDEPDSDVGEAEARLPNELEKAQVEAVVAAVRKNKLTLGSNLEKALAWQLENDELVVSFDTAYAANAVKQDTDVVSHVSSGVLGRKVRLRVQIVRPEEQKNQNSNPRVELVRKVFRGDVVQ
ncbi:MAG TPA: DNA polymerase III subunit gamma/tau [Spirochaetia bacterium]|nr:DNA polymerase III subunit gamma/tau [Spirochaetia bacterium]